MKKISKLSSLKDSEFIEAVESSNNMYELFNKIGYAGRPSGRSVISINSRLKALNIYQDFKKKSHIYNEKNKKNYTVNDILVRDSNYLNRTSLKKKIIEQKIIDYRCDICGNNGIWLNKKITLQLDHINGINNDNRVENLRFLCPNCHSQTSTYTGKNTKKNKVNKCVDCGEIITRSSTRCRSCSKKLQPNKRPNKDILEKTLLENKYNFSKVGRIFGVSDNAVRKWFKSYGIYKKD